MKNKKIEAKKILHFAVIILILLALVFGIIFSSIQVGKGVRLGSQYRGGYQAVVGVYDVNKKSDKDKDELPNGDAKKAASVLQNKLSPFSDGSVNVTIDGLSRLIVQAPRDSYFNNQQRFVDAIQSTGGLFIFNDQNKDIMLDSELMKKAGLKGDLDNKSATSELLGDVSQVSMQLGSTNRPFLKFDLKNDHFKNLNKAEEGKDNATKLTMVVDSGTALNNFRNYFTAYEKKEELDDYVENFLNGVINPLQKKIADNKISAEETVVLKDFFTVIYWFQTLSGDWTTRTASLVDPGFIKDYLTVDSFKKLVYADNNPDHLFKYKNVVSKYLYDSNAVGKDFQEGGKYYNPLDISGTKVKVTDAFSYLTKNVFEALIDKKRITNDNPIGINDAYFKPDFFNDYFIYSGAVGTGKNLPNQNQGAIVENNFYIGTRNYTIAKKAAAQISQTATGLTFHVFSVSETNAVISNAMFIASIVVLLVIALAIATFIVFFYRLLGIFTIIIAAIIASLTIMMNAVFGIAMGPEIVAIMFVLIGLIMDISVVLLESFKNNIYVEKRPLGSSFNISNRETLGLVTDVILAALLPNIVLFWIGIGFLKNFATILTMGIFFAFIFGVVVLRLLIYFTMKTEVLKQQTWLLPVDTSIEYEGHFLNHYLISMNQERLDNYSKKSQLSAKQLVKINRIESNIRKLQAKDQAYIAKRTQKLVAKIQKQKSNWERKRDQLLKKQGKVHSHKHFSYLQTAYYNHRLKYLNNLLQNENKVIESSSAILQEKMAKIEKNTTKIGAMLAIITLFFGILAIILSFTVGLNYSSHFGKGTQYYVYGTYVSETYDKLAEANSIEGIENSPARDEIVKTLQDIRRESKESVLKEHNLNDQSPVTEQNKYKNEWESLGVYRAYRYMISNNYMRYLTNRVTGVSFKNPTYMYGADYSMIDSTSGSFTNQPWVAVITTNNLISKNNAVKDAFQIFAGRGSGANIPYPPKNDGGVLGMLLEPHTASAQMKQIAITIAIILLGMLVYMIIRFKWTYYVALALGLIMALVLTISLIVVLRVPFTIEALAGILGVIGFVLITGMLFLGKGKAIIVSKDEKTLYENFNQEIALQAEKKHLTLKFREKLRGFKNQQKEELAKFDSTVENYRVLKAEKRLEQQKIWKQFRNEQKMNLKEECKALNNKIRVEARKNNFLKEIFVEVLKFGILRTIFLSSFYLIIGIAAALTLTPVGIMGFTLVIGVVVATLVIITVVLPIWIQLERRRIRMRYGYKKFVNNLEVKNEEQIIAGLND